MSDTVHYRTDELTEHPYVRATTPTGMEVDIDVGMVPLIRACWERGLRTRFCCQGGPGKYAKTWLSRAAYIMFAPNHSFPFLSLLQPTMWKTGVDNAETVVWGKLGKHRIMWEPRFDVVRFPSGAIPTVLSELQSVRPTL